MAKHAVKYGRYGRRSTDNKGRYTPYTQGTLKRHLAQLKDGVPAHFNTLKELKGIAERLDSIAIYMTELPYTWVKGTVHDTDGKNHFYCLMGYSEGCKKKIARIVDFDNATWNGAKSTVFNTFASDFGLVDLNDNDDIDLPTFTHFIQRTAVALRDYVERIETGNKNQSWAGCVDRAFWRTRKTLGLVPNKSKTLATMKAGK